jgi:hypothetical protein
MHLEALEKKDVSIYCSISISTQKYSKWITNYYRAVILCLTFRLHYLLYKHKEKHSKRIFKLDAENHSKIALWLTKKILKLLKPRAQEEINLELLLELRNKYK